MVWCGRDEVVDRPAVARSAVDGRAQHVAARAESDEVHDLARPPPRLRDVATLFLKLGVISFGGPAAHIALMREEAVRRRKWVSDEQFLDLLGASNLIPGPTATELAIYLGGKAGVEQWFFGQVMRGAYDVPVTLAFPGGSAGGGPPGGWRSRSGPRPS